MIIIVDNNLKNGTVLIAVKVEICPTKPHVPMPAPIGEFSSLKIIVENGPSIAEARGDLGTRRCGSRTVISFLPPTRCFSVSTKERCP